MRKTSNIILSALVIIFLIYLSVFAYMVIDGRSKPQQAKYKFDIDTEVTSELVLPVHDEEGRFFGNPVCEYDDKGNCPLEPYVERHNGTSRPVISVPVTPSYWLFLFGGLILWRKK